MMVNAILVFAAIINAISPNGRNEIRLDAEKAKCEILRDGEKLSECGVGLFFNGLEQSLKGEIKVESRQITGKAKTPIYKKDWVDLSARETFADWGGIAVRLIARDDGVAYRWEINAEGEVAISGEKVELELDKAADCTAYFGGSIGCEERTTKDFTAGAMVAKKEQHIYLPMEWKTKGNVVLFAESDTENYPILNLKVDGDKLKSYFAKYPKTEWRRSNDPNDWSKCFEVEKGGRWVFAKECEEYLVKSKGARTLPWRVFVIAEDEAKLVEADTVYVLAKEPKGDFSWVKPGKVQWDWWNGWDNQGMEGCNTAIYKRFFDFAAEHGVEYIIFDEGWSQALDIWNLNPEVDLKYLIEYGNERGVGTILWIAWAQAYGEEAKVVEHFAKMGVKGFKVDFMDRGDAKVEQFLWKFADECAKWKMVVDYHGIHHPTGLERTYPNVLNFEGVLGLENTKFGSQFDYFPLHDVKTVYLRNAIGPMDYTPGAMDNYYTSEEYNKRLNRYTNPGSIGTRCHQMAMMAMYFAPLQMLCDAPSKYAKNLECFKFMAGTPVVWSEVVALPGGEGDCVAIARKAKDGSWYAAGLNGPKARKCRFETKFLGGGEWEAEIFRDEMGGKATAYIHEERKIKAGDGIEVEMESGGGFAIRFLKVD